jgi:F-type H+-transporting ATPase subunit gamma
MASAKDIKKKIRSVSNTRKITRTMEMVATVKSKKGQDRLRALVPYSDTVFAMFRNLAAMGSISHPLLGSAAGEGGDVGADRARSDRSKAGRPKADGTPTLVLVVTGNRGLCGGYNSNVLSLAEDVIQAEGAAGRKTEVYMVGKKGVARFRFRKIPVAKAYVALGDNPTFQEASDMADEIMRRFLAGEVGRVVAAATIYESSTVHRPAAIHILPLRDARIEVKDPEAKAALEARRKQASQVPPTEFIFEPDRETVLEALVPMAVKMATFRILVEARTSEQIARRVAMKMATDNAEQMIRTFTVRYNRQRQAAITRQIVEIVSGAEALE